MRHRTTALVMAVLVVGSVAAVPMAGLAAQTTETPTNETAETNATAPGEQLAGVVGVQEAEIEGEVDSRAYGIRVAQAASNDSKAAVVGQQLTDVEQRLDELEDRRAELEQARENGSMSEGQYRARVARLAAETRTVERLADQSNETAQSLPAETLEANGVNATAIRTLSERADELSGPEVAEIARSIAGEGFGPDRAGERGADRGTDTSNESDGRDRGGDARDGQNETNGPTETTENADSDSRQTTADEQRSTDTDTETDRQQAGSDAGDEQGR